MKSPQVDEGLVARRSCEVVHEGTPRYVKVSEKPSLICHHLIFWVAFHPLYKPNTEGFGCSNRGRDYEGEEFLRVT